MGVQFDRLFGSTRIVKTSYLQKINGIWRVRMVVPPELGRGMRKKTLVRSTSTRSKREAKSRAAPIIAEFRAEIAGPPFEDDEIEALAEGWWRLFQLERSRQITKSDGVPTWPNGRARLDDINPREWALASDNELSQWVQWFITGPRQWPFHGPDSVRDKVESLLGSPKRSAQLLLNTDAMGRLLRNCRIIHDEAARGDILGGDHVNAIARTKPRQRSRSNRQGD